MNDADTLGYLLLTSYMAGTTSQPRMRNSAHVSVELASGGWRPQRGWYSGPRCQWVPGHVVNDADTWGSYHLPPISWEPRPSPKCAAVWCWIEVFESGMGLRVLSGRVRREFACLTPYTCY